MNNRKLLVLFVVLSWLFVALGIAIGEIEISRLQGPFLRSFEILDSQPLTRLQILVTFICISLIISNFIASIFICLLKRWARPLYLWSLILLGVVILFMGPVFCTPVSDFCYFTSTIFSGLTLGMLYLSPMKSQFAR